MCRSKRRGYRWWFGSVAKEAVPQTAGSIERETLVTEPAELGMRAATLRSDSYNYHLPKTAAPPPFGRANIDAIVLCLSLASLHELY